MSGVLTAVQVELRKILSTHMWWILLLVMILYIGGFSSLMAFSLTSAATVEGAEGGADAAAMSMDATMRNAIYTLAVPFGYVFPALIGILAITTEYRYKSLTYTFLAEPRRLVVLTGKLLASAVLGLVYGTIGVLSSFLPTLTILALTDQEVGFDGDLVAMLTRAVLAMTLWAVVGLGLGTLVRNQVAAIVVVVAFSQLVEPILRFALPSWELTEGLSKIFPGAAGDALVGVSFYTVGSDLDTLDWWQGGLVLGVYAVVLFAAGAFLTSRRDVS